MHYGGRVMIAIFKKFFKFADKQKKVFYQCIVLSIVFSFFEALKIPAISIALDAFLNGKLDMNVVWKCLVIMLLSIIGGCIVKFGMTMRQTSAGFNMIRDKRISIGDHLKFIPMGYFNSNGLGHITSVTTTTLENMQESATTVIRSVIAGYISTALIAVFITIYDWRMGLIIIVGIILFLIVNQQMQKKTEKLAPIKAKEDSALAAAVLEYVQGIGIVKSYNLDKQTNQKLNGAIDNNESINFNLEKTYVPYTGLQSLILKGIGVVMVAVSIYLYLAGGMDQLTCILMIISSFIIYGQLEAAGSYSSLLRILDVSMDMVNEIFDTPTIDTDGKAIAPDTMDIEFEGVDFSYGDRDILKGVDFKVQEKSTTAIVGPSGSGKSTIVNLIARFWDVNKGKILIGGHDVREYTLESLLKNISIVFQDVYLFNDTIANNIKFGRPDASIQEVKEAAKKACCDEFIEALTGGYDTIIGEGGASLSGGEKQRISIARAILKNAPIILLDEATASVDPENEKQLTEAIDALTREKTIVMIAHRLKTVKNAQQILVIDNGKVVQRGNHNELSAEPGIYADFIKMREASIGWKLEGGTMYE